MKPDKTYTGRSTIRMYNCDCMEFMKHIDEPYDLGIVDPPYGIGFDGQKESTSKHGGRRAKEFKGWDNNTPDEKYFKALFSVSENQIIWGANYFTKYLPAKMGWIFWDKGQRICNSDGELAFTSFQKALRVYEVNRAYITQKGDTKHPTQKPYKLYKWLLTNYATEGDTILDTHGGSMSIAIACWDLGFDLDICELDTDYFNDAVKRFENHIAQTQMVFQ